MQDANYNIVAIFDNAGTVVERYAYDPFGQVTVLDAGWNVLAASVFAWFYLHQGGRFDPTSGLYHFRHRDYSPTLGRWTSLDPIRYAAGDVNLYRFVFNAPTLFTDPSGLDGQPHWFWDYASFGLYPAYRYFRAWWRGRELDARLDEVQRQNHDPVAAVMQSGGGTWSIRNTYGLADPAFERNWQEGMGHAAVLANVGVTWAASGPMWVTPSGQTFVWTNGRWWNSTANRAATAQEAAAANRAVAAARAPGSGGAPTALNPLSREARDRLRAAARDIWLARTGRRAIWDGLEVHHRIPLEWSHLFPNSDPNRISNLIGMTPANHTQVSNAWNTWRQSLNGRTPTQAEVLQQAIRIDEQFGHLMRFLP